MQTGFPSNQCVEMRILKVQKRSISTNLFDLYIFVLFYIDQAKKMEASITLADSPPAIFDVQNRATAQMNGNCVTNTPTVFIF